MFVKDDPAKEVQERTDNGNSTGFVRIEVSEQVLFWIFTAIMILLTINLLFLCYINLCHQRSAPKQPKYSKVDVMASSDDDPQNFEEMNL